MFHMKGLFCVMSVYYAFLGVIFAFIPATFFDYFSITYPNHWGYVHVIGFTSLIWALMSWKVFRNPVNNKELIPYLALMHLFYTAGIIVDSGLFGMPSIWLDMAYASAFTGVLYFGIYLLLKKGIFNSVTKSVRKKKK